MLLEVKDTLQEIKWEDQQHDLIHVAILNRKEFEAQKDIIFNTTNEFHLQNDEITHLKPSHIETYDQYYMGDFVVMPHKDRKSRYLIQYYIEKNFFLIVSDYQDWQEAYIKAVKKLGSAKMTLEHCVYLFFNHFIKDDFEFLEKLQDTIAKIDETIIKEKMHEFTKTIEAPRKIILRLDHYYDHLLEMGEELQANEAGLFEDTDYFRIYTNRISRLHNSTQLLKEYLMQVREAYQSMIDTSLNSVMKLLTVLTAIFQPLTLIVGWYGMNFTNMPELTWQYGYLFVIFLSLASLFICFWYFRKKRFL